MAGLVQRQGGDRVIIAGPDTLQDTVNQVGQEVTRRNLNIQPTLTSRPGLPLPKTENVKRTFACSASLKADLDRYAALHAQTYGEAVDAATLIRHMLEAFMAGDRGFNGAKQR